MPGPTNSRSRTSPIRYYWDWVSGGWEGLATSFPSTPCSPRRCDSLVERLRDHRIRWRLDVSSIHWVRFPDSHLRSASAATTWLTMVRRVPGFPWCIDPIQRVSLRDQMYAKPAASRSHGTPWAGHNAHGTLLYTPQPT